MDSRDEPMPDYQPAGGFEYWGNLVVFVPGGRPRQSETLSRLLEGIVDFLIKDHPSAKGGLIPPDTMGYFYDKFSSGEVSWKETFMCRSGPQLSSVYNKIGCEYCQMPHERVPALTRNGFKNWMFKRIIAFPKYEVPLIKKILSTWSIIDTNSGQAFPSLIPPESLPKGSHEDTRLKIGEAWKMFPQNQELCTEG